MLARAHKISPPAVTQGDPTADIVAALTDRPDVAELMRVALRHGPAIVSGVATAKVRRLAETETPPMLRLAQGTPAK